MMQRFARGLVMVLALLAWLPAFPAAAQGATDQEKIQALEDRAKELNEQIATAEELLAGQLPAENRRAIEGQLERWRNALKDVETQLAELKGEPAPAAEDDEANAEEIRRLKRRITAIIGRMTERQKEIDRLRQQMPAAGGMQPPGGLGAPGDGGIANEGPAGGPEGEGDAAAGAGAGTMMGGTRLQQLWSDQTTDFMELRRLQTELEALQNARKPTQAFDDENVPELHPLMLYAGDAEASPYKPTFGSWGSGLIEESEYGVVQGLKSLLVYTDGFYRGGRIDFTTAPEIGLYFERPDISYLQFDVYFFPDDTATTGAGGPMGEGSMMMPGGLGSAGMPPPGGGSGVIGTPGGPLGSGSGSMGPPGWRPGDGGPGIPGGGSGGMGPTGWRPGGGTVPGGGSAGMGPGGPGGMTGPGMMPGPAGMPGSGTMPGPAGMPGAGGGIENEAGMGGMEGLTMPPGGDAGLSMPGGMSGMAAAKPAQPKTRSLRIVLYTDRGPIVAEDFYFDYEYSVNPGWTRVFVPIKEMVNISERVPTTLSRMTVFGDTTDEFYIGMIRLVADEVPLKPEILGTERQQAIAGEEFQLQAVMEGGLSILKYVWDWGDGEITETETPHATHLYVKPGDYTVTLTVKDTDGLKDDGRANVRINVIPFSERPMTQPGAGMMPGGMPPGGLIQPPGDGGIGNEGNVH